MINLFTGVPGAGKTCMALTYMKQMTKEGRPLFVHGIPELKIPHVDVYCSSPNCDVCSTYTDDQKQNMHPADMWHEWAPDGAVLFFDEVQNVYRPRSSGSKVPPSIQAFEVHRHRGLDFYLVSQSPKLFDSNIRQLISRHIHLKANWLGRFQYEWPECKENTQSTADAIKSSYKLDSKMFALYKSASLHTKQKRKVPPALYVFGVAVLAAGYLGFNVFSRISTAVAGEEGEAAVAAAPSSPAAHSPMPSPANSIPSNFDFKPTIKGVLESAPAYANLVKVKDFPRIAACISDSDRCVCYTQQMTIYPTTVSVCLAHINADHTAFNPFIEPTSPGSVDIQKSQDTGSFSSS